MSNSTSPEMIDPSNFMSLDKAERETGLADISILFYSPEVLLDCTPIESSYVWMGTGITDRDLRRMPNFGLLLQESREELSRRLCNYLISKHSFALLHNLKVKTKKGFLRLSKPVRDQKGNMPRPSLKVEDIPRPVLLVSADLELYRQKAAQRGMKTERKEAVMEGEPCLVWDNHAEELKKLAHLLEQHGYIESADIWCQHFRTSGESALKKTNVLPIKWLKRTKLIHIVLAMNAVRIKKDEWEIHFGISKPGGFEKGEKTDEQLLEIIREAKQ